MNNCVNFDVVFIKWYLRRMTECSCRLLPNAVWFLNLTSLALFFGLFPSSIFLSFFISFFLLFRLEICTLNLAPLWVSVCVFSKYDYLMKLYCNWPNNSSSSSIRSKKRHSSAIIKSAHSAPPFTSLSFALGLSRSGHLFTSIISWNLFVCRGLFVLSVDGVVIFCFSSIFIYAYIKVDYSVADPERWL